MKPAEVLRKEVDREELMRLSRGRLIKATDGRRLIVARNGRIVLEKGGKLKEKTQMVVAVYTSCRKIRVRETGYLVNKLETVMSSSVLEDIKKLREGREDIIIVAFSRKARRVTMLYRNGNLCYIEGDYRKLITENRAIIDAYEILDMESADIPAELQKASEGLVKNVAEGG